MPSFQPYHYQNTRDIIASSESNLNAAFHLHRFFFDIDHTLTTVTPRSTVKHEYVHSPKICTLMITSGSTISTRPSHQLTYVVEVVLRIELLLRLVFERSIL
jgi:hypothetical protein